jgi:hypothetical protein
MNRIEVPADEEKGICIFAGQTEATLHFFVCRQCPSHLETCSPCVGDDGYLHGSECDLYLCEDCTVEACIYHQSNLERGR